MLIFFNTKLFMQTYYYFTYTEINSIYVKSNEKISSLDEDGMVEDVSSGVLKQSDGFNLYLFRVETVRKEAWNAAKSICI